MVLPPALTKRLHIIAQREGRTPAEIIQNLLDDYERKQAAASDDVVSTPDDDVIAQPTKMDETPRRKAGSAQGQIKMAPDFDASLSDFREYTE